MDERKILDSKILTQYLYYFIIGILSLIACFFLPMLGSEVGLGFKLPDTTAGWIVYIMTKLIIAVINVLLFHCFMEQAKVNIKKNPNYIRANEILLLHTNDKKRAPRSPASWQTKQYLSKGVSIFITSVLSAFALTNAILAFDLAQMLVYLFTIVMGLIFGILQMKTAEVYWTEEYYEYALMIEKKHKMEEQNGNQN